MSTIEAPPVVVYEPHPFAAQFRILEGPELSLLSEDIVTNGQHEPILLWRDGEKREWLLDGRNRWLGCTMAGVEPKMTWFRGTEVEAIQRIVAANIHRRHDTPSTRAALVAAGDDLVAALMAEAKAAMAAGGAAAGRGRPLEKGPSAPTDPIREKAAAEARETASKLAAVAGVGRTTMKDVLRVKKEDPALFAEVAAGKVTANAAGKELRVKAQEKVKNTGTKPQVKAGKYGPRLWEHAIRLQGTVESMQALDLAQEAAALTDDQRTECRAAFRDVGSALSAIRKIIPA